MTTISASEARAKLYSLLKEISKSHSTVLITGKNGNGVLVAEEDWQALQETIYLLSVPGMRESIREGMKTPIENCSDELDW